MIKLNPRQYKLQIELVPATSWYNNLRKVLTPTEWDTLRREVYAKAVYKCEICQQHSALHCHELWIYDDVTHVQKLSNLQALCPNCHMIKHIGFSMGTEDGQKKYDTTNLIRHFCKVNCCTRKDFKEQEKKAFEIWQQRSKYQWKVDFGEWSTLIERSKNGNDFEINQLRNLMFCGPARTRLLVDSGIRSVEAINQLSETEIARLTGFRAGLINVWKKHAFAIINNKFKIERKPNLADNYLYYDIETGLSDPKVWLIGLYYPREEKFIHFFEKNPKKHPKMLENFLQFLGEREFPQMVSYSGTSFDKRTLAAYLGELKLNPSPVLENDMDLLKQIRGKVFGPFYNYKLKHFAAKLGYEFTHEDLSGLEVGAMYDDYLRKKQGRSPSKREPNWKKLLKYNKDDVMALKFVVDKINEIAE